MALFEKLRFFGTSTGLLIVAAAATAAWAYYPTGRALVRLWHSDPNYSQGFLVPILALGLLWYRAWERPPGTAPAPWWGLSLLAGAVGLRTAGAYFFVTPFDHLSLLASLVAICLLFGGPAWLNRAWPALALLVFMFPIPSSVGGTSLTDALQSIATRASTFALQTFGVVAAREGNLILLKTTELGVVEACSGLRMLTVFCALALVAAALVPAGWVRKAILVVSAVPLAIACNVIRITTAGVASESLGTETGYFIFHDLAGWLMVPLAFLLLGAEVFVLSKLFRPVPSAPAWAPGSSAVAAV
ncbi:exosortase/archaeosortase family protein [Gemmata sp. G18]|uniref:Exosortase/archaeosortase family protein n=1 Tax=Gemmata palustris TaxID=2822762 RepID=A0ABS5C266_9BACT|nr:exosortase/archaeosortase family protein [Gemmata palustris]MBP3960070.1 exosortase/archaeosortase family protein [Gemmata palustris]